MVGKNLKKTLGLVLVLSFVLAIFVWKRSDTIVVDIQTFDPLASVTLAKAESVEVAPRWFPVERGPNRLDKGAYFFRLDSGGGSKEGLIAINDQPTIVLK
jgi:hypothetical protein